MGRLRERKNRRLARLTRISGRRGAGPRRVRRSREIGRPSPYNRGPSCLPGLPREASSPDRHRPVRRTLRLRLAAACARCAIARHCGRPRRRRRTRAARDVRALLRGHAAAQPAARHLHRRPPLRRPAAELHRPAVPRRGAGPERALPRGGAGGRRRAALAGRPDLARDLRARARARARRRALSLRTCSRSTRPAACSPRWLRSAPARMRSRSRRSRTTTTG